MSVNSWKLSEFGGKNKHDTDELVDRSIYAEKKYESMKNFPSDHN